MGPDYLNSVMRKSPPTPKPILDLGVLVIAIAIPPSKANTPTTAIVDRLTCLVKGWIVPKSPAMGRAEAWSAAHVARATAFPGGLF